MHTKSLKIQNTSKVKFLYDHQHQQKQQHQPQQSQQPQQQQHHSVSSVSTQKLHPHTSTSSVQREPHYPTHGYLDLHHKSVGQQQKLQQQQQKHSIDLHHQPKSPDPHHQHSIVDLHHKSPGSHHKSPGSHHKSPGPYHQHSIVDLHHKSSGHRRISSSTKSLTSNRHYRSPLSHSILPSPLLRQKSHANNKSLTSLKGGNNNNKSLPSLKKHFEQQQQHHHHLIKKMSSGMLLKSERNLIRIGLHNKSESSKHHHHHLNSSTHKSDKTMNTNNVNVNNRPVSLSKSAESIASVGIGGSSDSNAAPPATTPAIALPSSLTTTINNGQQQQQPSSSISMPPSPPQQNASSPKISITTNELPKLVPEGAYQVTEPVYDCIIYLIYCPEHDKIAVTNIDKVRCTWLPFVALPDGDTWEKASHDGVAILIGRTDAEMDAEEAEKMAPIYTMSLLHMLRIQLPCSRMVLRLARFVHLQKNENFQCCQNTNRVHWIPSSDILSNRVPKIWGPELKILTSMLVSQTPQSIINEFTANDALYYLYLDSSAEQRLLQHEARLKDSHLLEIYTDYVEHCYPSFYMCYESLRAYLIRYGHLASDEHRLTRLFAAFCFNRRSFVDFHEFLLGLIILEPNCSSKNEVRQQFIFRYYDVDKKGYLTETNIFALYRDALNTTSSSSDTDVAAGLTPEMTASLTNQAQSLLRGATQLTLEDMQQLVLTNADFESKLNIVCRSPRSVLKQISHLLVMRNEERLRGGDNLPGAGTGAMLKAKRATKGTCMACRAQQYEYGNHCVTLDTIGRCVEPNIISRPWLFGNNKNDDAAANSHLNSRTRHSLEYVFTISSVPNIFIDLIRDFQNKREASRLIGLMTMPEDWPTFNKYFRILCKDLAGILGSEDRLIKSNAPAIVVGDLAGNLHDLLQLEKLFFQSFPVIPEDLIFLGNYSGEHGCSVECLIYLFSLKLCAPNKVFLLRGFAELNDKSAIALRTECTKKYGQVNGRNIYVTFVDIFAKLPVAVVVDENVLCLHSGLPTTTRLDRVARLPKDIRAPERNAPLIYEIITRFPREPRSTSNKSGKSGTGSEGSLTSNTTTTTASGNALNKYTNVSKLIFGGGEFHPISSGGYGGAGGGTKMEQHTIKSIKSLKKSVRLKKSLSGTGSKRRTSSAGSGNSVASSYLSPPAALKSTDSSAARSVKSLSILSNSKTLKSKSGTTNSTFKASKYGNCKLKPMFLKSVKMSRRMIKLKHAQGKSTGGGASTGTKSNRFPEQRAKLAKVSLNERAYTYDKNEFFDFMRVNDLSYLIRSHSICSLGFRLNFDTRCVTIFSCSNYGGTYQNEAAVALIDGSNYSVRLIRYDSSCNDVGSAGADAGGANPSPGGGAAAPGTANAAGGSSVTATNSNGGGGSASAVNSGTTVVFNNSSTNTVNNGNNN